MHREYQADLPCSNHGRCSNLARFLHRRRASFCRRENYFTEENRLSLRNVLTLCGKIVFIANRNHNGDEQTNTDKMKFTYQDGLNIQAQDLAEWKKKLNAECYDALRLHCQAVNSNQLPSEKVDGLKVFREEDLTEFVLNWSH